MCVYYGIPLPELQWKYDGIDLSNSLPRITIFTNNTVSVLFVNDMMGESGGIYTCEANNIAGISSINFTIECKCFVSNCHTNTIILH